MQKMDSLITYGKPEAHGSNEQIRQDSALSGSVPVFAIARDSASIKSDSVSLISGDSIFIFGQNQTGDNTTETSSKLHSDTSYAEHLIWEGLNMTPREKSYPGNDWLTGMLFLAFVLLASVKAGYSKYISSVFQSLINYPTAFRMFREKNYSILHGAFRLEVLYYLVFSIFIFQVIVLVSPEKSLFNWLFFGKTLAAVVIYFFAKKMAYRALGSIFIGANDTSEFLFNMDNFNRGAGIILFPIVALIAYYPSDNPMIAVFLGVLTTSVFYVMLLKRGISILLKKQFPIFYLFLYLCTLEFLPLLLIYKVVVD